jgi:hypothetical protein
LIAGSVITGIGGGLALKKGFQSRKQEQKDYTGTEKIDTSTKDSDETEEIKQISANVTSSDFVDNDEVEKEVSKENSAKDNEEVHFIGDHKAFFESGKELIFLKYCTETIRKEIHTKTVECLATRSGSIILTLQGDKSELKRAVEWLKRKNSFKVEGFQELVPKATHVENKIEDIQDQPRSNHTIATWTYVIAITAPLLIIFLCAIFMYIRYYRDPRETIDCSIFEENNTNDLEDDLIPQDYPKLDIQQFEE